MKILSSIIVSLIENSLLKILETPKGILNDKVELNRLRQLYLLECHFNLKVLYVARNKRLSKKDVFRLLKNLSNDSSKLFYSTLNKNVLDMIFKEIRIVKDSDKDSNEILLLSVINKIEIMKILSLEFTDLESAHVIRINARVNNLYQQLQEVTANFTNQINN